MKQVIIIWVKLVSFIGVMVVILLVALNTDIIQFLRTGDLDEITFMLDDNPFYQYFFTFVIMLIQNSFTIIPLILIITINYTLFGFFNGLVWSWFTSIIAAAIWFYGSRYFFHEWVKKKSNPEILAKIERNGFLFVFQARIFPFVPTSLINIVGGLSTIKFKHFIFGTMAGNLIFFFVLSLIPAGLMTGKTENFVLLSITIILILGMVLYRYKRRSKKTKEAEEKLHSGSL